MLRFLPINAPGRYVFIDPDTGREFRSATKRQLIVNIVNYRVQNGLAPLHNLSQVIDDYLCRLPENVGKCEEYQLKLTRGWIAYFTGAMHVLKNVFMGEENMVPSEEAVRRANVCRTCPRNVFPDKGPFMKYADDIAINSTGGKTTPLDGELGNCEACSCVLRSLIWAKNPGIEKGEEEKHPDFCWKRK